MTCEEASLLLDSYADGEFIDAVHYREVEAHLANCDACRHKLQAIKAIGRLATEQETYYRAPESLHLSIAAIGQLKETPKANTGDRTRLVWTIVNLGWSIAIVAILGIFVAGRNRPPSIEAELIAGHIRSLQATHLFDVPSSDKHTVKPWFQGKIDFSPEVPNLASNGFPLLGGRLDYINRQPVAALVYARGKHMINVFVTTETTESDHPSLDSEGGYHVVHWTEQGLVYWAVSDADSAALGVFKESFLSASNR